MNSYSAVKAFLMISILGSTLSVNANVITCTETEPLVLLERASTCQRSLAAAPDFLGTVAMNLNQDAFFGHADGVLLKKDDLVASVQQAAFSDYANAALTKVSEPASFVLMILGLLGLRLVRRQTH